MRKLIISFIVISMIFSTTSCSNKNKNNSIAENLLDKSYCVDIIDENCPISNIEEISYLGDSNNYLITGYNNQDEQLKLYIVDDKFINFKPIDLKLDQNYNVLKNGITSTTDEKIIAFVKIDNDNIVENPCTSNTSYNICVFDTNGNKLNDNEIKNIDNLYASNSEEIYIKNFLALGENYLVNVEDVESDRCYLLNSNCDILENVNLGENAYLYNTGIDTENNVVFSASGNNSETIHFINSKTPKVTSEYISFSDLSIELGTITITRGKGDYKFFLSTDRSIYGIKENNSAEEIVNWIDSNINSQYIKNIIAISSEEFIVLEKNWNSNMDSCLYRLSKKTNSELSNTKTIMLTAEYMDDELINMVDKFNQSHSEYQIKIKSYQKYYEVDGNNNIINLPESQLKMDIISGEQFDIIILDSEGDLYYNLENKGMFTDISKLMENNVGITKNEIVPNVLKSCESNGNLYRISPTFTVQTYAAKKKYVDKNNWTIDEMIDIYKNLDKNMNLLNYSISKTDLFLSLFINSNNSFVDYNNHKCNFNSPDFINLLEFIDDMKLNDEINWETVDPLEYESIYNNMETACLNDKALLQFITLSDARDYTRVKYGIFADEISLIGAPTSVGNGAKLCLGTTFSIAETSLYKDICWEFINQFFTDDYYNNQNIHQFPSLKKNLDDELNNAMNDPFFINENGKKEIYHDSMQINNQSVEIPNLTLKERDILSKYILNSETTTHRNSLSIYKVINEEINAYFNGTSSAEETANILQNRISIILSENN